MSTRISSTTEHFLSRDGKWLGDLHGIDVAVGATYVLANFVEADHYPDGYLRDGIPVARLASGKFVAWDKSAGDGSEVLFGIILEPAIVKSGDTEVVSAVYHHGGVIVAALLDGAASGVDTVTEADLPARMWAR